MGLKWVSEWGRSMRERERKKVSRRRERKFV
jgi:hypothetical protein